MKQALLALFLGAVIAGFGGYAYITQDTGVALLGFVGGWCLIFVGLGEVARRVGDWVPKAIMWSVLALGSAIMLLVASWRNRWN